MPLLRRGRLLKRWRYVGVWGPDVMLCAGAARIGPAPQSWWAVWERDRDRMHERTRLGPGGPVHLARDRVRVRDGAVELELALDDAGAEPVEVVTPDGRGYAWTRKRAPLVARGFVRIDGAERSVEAAGLSDESAGYHARHTAWRWCAGVGTARRGDLVAWNLVTGIHDSPAASERTVWAPGGAREVGPVRFADDLGSVSFAEGGELEFRAGAVRARRDSLLLVRSDYEQPFGTFSGTLPGGVELAEGHGVMERHVARW